MKAKGRTNNLNNCNSIMWNTRQHIIIYDIYTYVVSASVTNTPNVGITGNKHHGRSLIGTTIPELPGLVNIQKAIENCDFLWIYQLKMGGFSSSRVSNYSNCCWSTPKLSHFSFQNPPLSIPVRRLQPLNWGYIKKEMDIIHF